ncbi:MAG: porin family protein [Candidatus Latescibacterota bacterium]|nr:MAG: porin family protein [Candidatus Latescibacterota bacterium]
MKRVLFLIAFASILHAHPADALVPGNPSIGISYPFPVSPSSFTDTYNGSIGVSGTFSVVPLPVVSVDLELGYFRFGLDKEKEPSVQDGGDRWTFEISGVGRVPLPIGNRIKPYARGGVGVFWTRTTSITFSGESPPLQDFSDTSFGFLLGVGVDFGLAAGITIYVDGTYYQANSNTRYLPVAVGVRF